MIDLIIISLTSIFNYIINLQLHRSKMNSTNIHSRTLTTLITTPSPFGSSSSFDQLNNSPVCVFFYRRLIHFVIVSFIDEEGNSEWIIAVAFFVLAKRYVHE